MPSLENSVTVISRSRVFPDQKSTLVDLKLSVSDLPMLSCHYIQKGCLFTGPHLPQHALLSHLKHALSLTLSHFPPLAGRLSTSEDGHVFLSCNDAGADFVSAAAKSVRVSDVIEGIDVPEVVKEFFTYDRTVSYDGHNRPILAVQVTELNDGVFIGCSVNHSVTDGTSLWNFINTFAEGQGVYYYFYQVFRNQVEAAALKQKKKGLGDGSVGMFSSLLVAALAGSVNVLMTNPIWVIVTRMQTHKKMPKGLQTVPEPPSADVEALVPAEPRPYGTFNTIREIYDEAGVTGFWKGVIPTLIMVCNPAMQFMLYETMLSKLKKKRALKNSNNVTALETFLLGAVAKLGATVTTYPLLVVKSRLQAKQVATGDKRQHYKGTVDAILKMIRYEGLHGFYKGMSTKIVQSVFAAAVLFMIKEELVKGAKLLLSNATSIKSKPS
ncbi:hypothetical protein F2Q68_00024066 [Brassica cretica]|uniref:Uncharacterized protein n=1 Tax=Brassica cretica TaxID=69181 RepID=A0A8S9IHZ4_BRACR|nr:hypothetical protein F2Q68_00024066 [Brassica cretica]